jgi:spore coat polysaccharide biosynthesis protein SpsF
MSSKRLPGKALLKINKEPILQRIIKNLKYSNRIDKIIVATSNKSSDLPIISFCKKKKINFFAGELSNVAKRYKDILENNNFQYFLRISGDSPLVDYKLIDLMIKKFMTKKFDIVTNILERSYPKGQSIEILKSKIFIANYKKIKKNKFYKEHVTPYFYDNYSKFKIFNFKSKKDFSSINLSIDTPKDLKKIKKLVKLMNIKKITGWKKIAINYKNI